MKLLCLITRAMQAGAQAHVLELARGLRGGVDLELGIGEEGWLSQECRALGIDVHVLRHLVRPVHPLEDPRAVVECLQLIRRVQPDLVHAHSSKAGLIGRLAARIAGVPSVFTVHGWSFTEGVPLRQKLFALPSEYLAARLSSRIITVSDEDRSLGLRYLVCRPELLVTVHYGLSDSGHRAEPGAAGEVRMAMIARFSEQKDQALLLRAVAGIRQPFQLLLVGDGPLMEGARRQASELALDDRVEFLGARDDADEILGTCHVFVLASNWEGLPISILEAMRAGLPVVASDVNGVKEGVTDGVTGFLVPRGDADGLRDRLSQLVADGALRARMGRAGRESYEREFTRERMIEKLLNVYDEVLAGSR